MDLRRRTPFKSIESYNDSDTNIVLDEQEQNELVQTLRESNLASNRQYLMLLDIILLLSVILHSVSLLSPPNHNPLLSIFPKTSRENPSVPFPSLFILLALFLHINLGIHIHPQIPALRLDLHPISFPLTYALAAVAPTLALFLQCPWQTTLWWCFTSILGVIVQIILHSIAQSNESISELDAMKYLAFGA
ncbi:hypothetical protein BD779DRAFT_733146 [Infundibulicybe gibba]|nr:hypothetical protein BD779DRAFT_733146 [Infundibulicybe gibba]